MTYLIGQILFCLFFAGMTGFAVGWLFRGASGEESTASSSTGLPPALQARAEGREDPASDALKEENEKLRQRLQSGMRRLRDIEKKLATQAAPAGPADHARQSAAQSLNLDKERERGNALEASLHDTQAALAEKSRALASRDALLAKQSDTLQSLERRLASNSEVVKSASEAAEKNRLSAATASRIAEQVSAMDARLRHYDAECSRHDATIDRLGKNIAAVTEQAINMRSQVSGARQRLANAREQAQDDTQAAARRESEPALATRLASTREKLGKMEDEILERDKLIATLRQRLQNAQPEPTPQALPVGEPPHKTSPSDQPPWLLSQPDGEADDLKRIYGIGPVLERTLNELGVFHFRQVAELSSTDVAWLAARINSFPDRIIRDRWVEQARELTETSA